ncbi:2-amino-4-hydroxy-6-hydroxymethyldihydropteridine diphosphokinase [Methylovirgula sp. 4M-Z18]|uniref:2-amino-4-hydroxy-6- hydroxymethyldihydropteridine diphosphokinase n=1 Tax=Methylovirgula sp. 4M-Z18 TaxID=2293567 RepID=UPI000E2E8B56|nr:2-amino-4-hydroxy-6-hydroxymethyldihydropteridine diphosphokinase [Methylovirgula sp. 4M-Z18]RFB80137.1 2-amino-4-hydroxy-6-hydroxymethyldihydropteridine diphosphokinase [Methylovirgula sp. 4M-Z18]
MAEWVEACIGLGGNVGDVRQHLRAALHLLRQAPGMQALQASSLFRTPPWGKLDQPPFLNMAAIVRTSLSPQELLALCLAIERAQGRVREDRWGPRTLDLDILTYGDRHIAEPGLAIPHPHMAVRAFVLAPLAEIAPDLRVNDVPVRDLLAQLDISGIENIGALEG